MISSFEPPLRKILKRDDEIKMVMKKTEIIVFVNEESDRIEKYLSNFADSLSKPAHVHQYKLTSQSLNRASSLGLKAIDVIRFLKKYINKEIPIEARIEIEKYMKNYLQPELYLKQHEEGNYYVFKCDVNWWEDNPNRGQIELFLGESLEVDEGQFLQFLEGQERQTKIEEEKAKYIRRRVLKQYDLAYELFQKYSIFIKAERVLYKQIDHKHLKLINLEINFEKHPLHCKTIKISLKAFTKLRNYQSQALKTVITRSKEQYFQTAKNGYIVLPCGAGKTLLGISILTEIKKQALIVCSSDSGADQWKRQIQKWTQGFPRDQIIILTAQSEFSFKRQEYNKSPRIYITTYTSLKSKLVAKQTIKSENKWLKYMPWGLVIFDQCQTLPAPENRQVLKYLLVHVKIGLTATPMREDDEIKALNYMIGPRLYVGDWKTFVENGYLANPKCIEIRTSMTRYFEDLYNKHKGQRDKRQLCYKVNPNKVKALLYLLDYHERLKDNIIVFCDNINLIKFLADKLKRALLMGQTKTEERNFIFDMFRQQKIKTVFLSRIGDEAIDLPNANVAIEVNILQGSRKQMLQRLGRIMRQKEASSSNSYNALFYTIISDDTVEKKYFFNRYNCLIDEGFHYDVRFFDYQQKKGITDILKIEPEVEKRVMKEFQQIVGREDEYWRFFSQKEN